MTVKAKAQFSSYLKGQGLKWTPEREKIVQEVLATEGHFEAEELAYRLRKKGSRISKASSTGRCPAGESRFNQRGDLREKHHHYEHIHGEKEHDHLICLKCGEILEFQDDTLKGAEENL